MTEPKRPIPVKFCGNGSVEAYSCLTPTELKVRAQIAVPPSRVIPVLLVPGIMGSNLRKIKDHKIKVWNPPNGGGGNASAAFSGTFSGAANRQRIFIPGDAEVDDSGLIEMPENIPWLDAAHARTDRGWGTVHWASYGELLVYLETHLNHIYVSRELQSEWAQMNSQQDKARWGAQMRDKFAPVIEEELKRLPRALYPVYAVGYNWLQSNNDSAAKLKTRIDQIIAHWKQGRACEQVLLVTHSMGGLVARRCAQLVPDKVLGVVHGVLPALGAAATYKRMRAGFEDAAAVVLGWNEAEATATMASAPGPLELLPQARYNGGKPWLYVQAQETYGGMFHEEKLPLKDPYAEIYQKDAKTCWYGLVNSDLIDPAKLYTNPKRTPWMVYLDTLKIARKFHTDLGTYYHAHTYAYYGADQGHRAWGDVRWHTTDLTSQESPYVMSGEHPESNGTGKITTRVKGKKVSFTMTSQDAFGDGTVPADASGNDPTEQGVLQCFRLTGFDHQFAYNNPQVRLTTLYSLVKLAQNSPLIMKA